MWWILALGAAERILNRCIDLDAITRIQLNRLQGQCLRVVIDSPNMSIDVYFDDGQVRLEPTPTGQATRPSLFEQRPFDPVQHVKPATTTLQVKTLVALLRLYNTSDDELANIPLQGDYHLLFEIKQILTQNAPDLAVALSPYLGATFAHELGKIGQLPKQLRKTTKSAGLMLQDALAEDSGLFAPRWHMDDAAQDLRRLQQSIDRADAKLQQLEAIYSSSTTQPSH